MRRALLVLGFAGCATAEEFKIRFSDASVRTSEAFLRARLKELAGR
jgi:hypothetical protein